MCLSLPSCKALEPDCRGHCGAGLVMEQSGAVLKHLKQHFNFLLFLVLFFAGIFSMNLSCRFALYILKVQSQAKKTHFLCLWTVVVFLVCNAVLDYALKKINLII